MKNFDVLIKGVKKNVLYVLEGLFMHTLSTLYIKTDADRVKLWHLRLCHMSAKGL